MFTRLKQKLRLPESVPEQDLDSIEAAEIHARIIAAKPFLQDIYRSWYRRLRASLPAHEKADAITPPMRMHMLEVGSGGGFLGQIIPGVITSDFIPGPNIDLCLSALALPFWASTLDAVMLVDVLHHIHDPQGFFSEVDRCLKPGGVLVMIEPANTLWGRFVYTRFHAEPFDPEADWGFPPGGRLTAANSALPWIIFHRDRDRFERLFPALSIRRLYCFMPFLYLISGGLTYRQLCPSFTLPFWKAVEKILTPIHKYLGMFMYIELRKKKNEDYS